MSRSQIRGGQVKDETITEDDIKDGSIKAAELHIEAITGQALHTGAPDEANDMLLLYDQSANSLKKMPLSDVAGSGGGGGGESLSFVTGHVDMTPSNKPVNWVNASNISTAAGIKSWFIVPKATTIDKVIISVKGNNFSTANDGNVTLNIYKNQPDFNTTILSQTVGADDFSQIVSNMSGGTTDCNQKIFTGLNQSVAEGDLIHIKVGKSAGSDKEALVTVVFSTASTSSIRDVSASLTALDTDRILRCIHNSPITITLPSKSNNAGQELIIKDALGNAGTHTITIDGDGNDTIDGAATFTLSGDYKCATLICDSINGWMVVGSHS